MATGSIQSNMMKGILASQNVSITAGSHADIAVDFSSVIPDGYKMVAVNSILFSGTYSEYLVLSTFSISNSLKKVNIRVRSLASSSTISAAVNVWVACAKNYTT